ncbi:16S rRNA (guanine(527)-N(7))-methyltransferase RsmG [bacterium]|nr:16S rRNA (guanine(527)-N(7))-methyltransferase RsmG [bacterium]
MRKIVQIEDLIKKYFPNLKLSLQQINLFVDYFDLLTKWNKKINLTAIQDPSEMISKHLLDTLAVFNLIDRYKDNSIFNGKVIDFGSGAGIPGILLAISSPSLNLVSIDKSGKKIAFQQEVIRRLKLNNVKPLNERLEKLMDLPDYKNTFSLIITRAFDQIKQILYLGERFLDKSGKLILWKGQNWLQEYKQVDDKYKNTFDLVGDYRYHFEEYDRGGTLLLFRKK